MKLKYILKAWGWLCLFFAAIYLLLTLYAAVQPSNVSTPGSTGLGEWIGMGLLCLGLSRVLELLEKK